MQACEARSGGVSTPYTYHLISVQLASSQAVWPSHPTFLPVWDWMCWSLVGGMPSPYSLARSFVILLGCHVPCQASAKVHTSTFHLDCLGWTCPPASLSTLALVCLSIRRGAFENRHYLVP